MGGDVSLFPDPLYTDALVLLTEELLRELREGCPFCVMEVRIRGEDGGNSSDGECWALLSAGQMGEVDGSGKKVASIAEEAGGISKARIKEWGICIDGEKVLTREIDS